MRLKLLMILCPLLLFVSCEDNATTEYRVTSENGVYVRANPSSDGKIIGKMEKGDEFEVISIDEAWAKIKYKEGEAYVSEDCIKKNAEWGFWCWFFGLVIITAAGAVLKYSILWGLILTAISTTLCCIASVGYGHSWAVGLLFAGFCLIAMSVATRKLIDGVWVTIEPDFWLGIGIGVLMIGTYAFIAL